MIKSCKKHKWIIGATIGELIKTKGNLITIRTKKLGLYIVCDKCNKVEKVWYRRKEARK